MNDIHRGENFCVTDLHPWFTRQLRKNCFITGAWVISNNEKKQLVIKFNGIMPKMERMVYLRLIAKNIMEMVDKEDKKEGGKSSFGDLMGGMQLREWHKEDDEVIKNGISHEWEDIQ